MTTVKTGSAKRSRTTFTLEDLSAAVSAYQSLVASGLPPYDAKTEAVNRVAGETAAVEQDAQRVWAAYPHKVGKGGAMRFIRSALRHGVAAESMITAIEAYKRYVDENRKRGFDLHYAHGCTWFGQRRWEDVFAVQGEKKKSLGSGGL